MAIINGMFGELSKTTETVVVNKYKESYNVYIGRGSIWGNPYTVEQYGRDECIEMYRKYISKRLLNEPNLSVELRKLIGKRLGCFCKPKPCHGDVLIEMINLLYPTA